VSEPNYCTKCGTQFDGESCPVCLLNLGLSGAVKPVPAEPPKGVPKRQLAFLWPAIGALGIVVLVAAAFLRVVNRPSEGPVVRFDVPVHEADVGDIAISPDGLLLTFVATGRDGVSALWMHRMDSLDSSPMPGTEGASGPFWSPDSRKVAFFAQGKLRSIPISGGSAMTICDARTGRSGAWSNENLILFSGAGASLSKVGASGGTPMPVGNA